MVKSLQSLSEVMQSCASIIQNYVSYSPENITDTHEKKRKADAELNGKAKKVKKVKDPNEPKRPPSAYLAYQNSVREELKKASPDISNAALMGMISEKWKAMTPDERKVSKLFIFRNVFSVLIFCLALLEKALRGALQELVGPMEG
jgi:hypothetical protein